MTSLSRRTLLAGFAGGSVLAAGSGLFLHHLWKSLENHEGIYVNFVGPQGYQGKFKPGMEKQFKMVIWDIHSGEMSEIPVPFHVHSVTFDPRTNSFLGIQKWRNQMFVLDLQAKKISKVLKHPTGRQFIGHGVLHPEKEAIYISEGLFPKSPVGYAEGKICLRDIRTLKQLGEFPSYGENPHDMRLLRGGEVLIVCNQGTINRNPETRSNVALIERKTGRLLKRLEAPSIQHNFAHMDLLSEREALVVTKSRSGHPSLNNFMAKVSIDGKLEVFENGKLKDKTVGEILSVAVDRKRRVVAATNPDGKRVLFWDIATRKLLKSIEGFGRPLGISLTRDARHYIVSDLKQGTALIDAANLALETNLLPKEVRDRHFTLAHSTLLSKS